MTEIKALEKLMEEMANMPLDLLPRPKGEFGMYELLNWEKDIDLPKFKRALASWSGGPSPVNPDNISRTDAYRTWWTLKPELREEFYV